jgi:hypothetical protein
VSDLVRSLTHTNPHLRERPLPAHSNAPTLDAYNFECALSLAPALHCLQESNRVAAMQPVLMSFLNDKKQSSGLARTCTELHRCQRIGGASRVHQSVAGCTQSSAVRVLGLRCRPNTTNEPQAVAEGRREHWGLKAAVELLRRACDE